MLFTKIKTSFTKNSLRLFSILSIFTFLNSGMAHSESVAGLKGDSVNHELMTLSGLVSQTFIDSLLFFDGDHRSQESMQTAISSVDRILTNLKSNELKDKQILEVTSSHWQLVKKHINDMPEDPGYSYFYLERLSKAIDQTRNSVDGYVQSQKNDISKNDYDIYQTNSEILKVVTMHLSSAVMDVGNDEGSKATLRKHCSIADKNVQNVVVSNPSVKSYVLRSWKYIQAPICVTGKKGGNYTIAHFSKQIFSKLNNLYGSNAAIANGGL